MIRLLQRKLKALRTRFRQILRRQGSPAERARGIAVGVFCGCFPFFGFQTLFGIGLASFVRGNHLLAMLGTWISNPFTYIPLYWFNYKIGSFLFQDGTTFAAFSQLTTKELWSQSTLFSIRVFIGSALVGFFLGLISGSVSYFFFKYKSSTLLSKIKIYKN